MTPYAIAEARRYNRIRRNSALLVGSVFMLTIIGAPIGVVILLVELPRAHRTTRYLDREEGRNMTNSRRQADASRIRALRQFP